MVLLAINENRIDGNPTKERSIEFLFPSTVSPSISTTESSRGYILVNVPNGSIPIIRLQISLRDSEPLTRATDAPRYHGTKPRGSPMEATCLGHAAFPHLVGEEGKCGGLTGTRRGCGMAVVQAVREDRSKEFLCRRFWRSGLRGLEGSGAEGWSTEWVIEWAPALVLGGVLHSLLIDFPF